MKAIVAVDKNFAIGFKNNLLFKIKEDQQFFKQITINNTIVMGSNTFKSIGRALPNRSNIIITRYPDKYKNNNSIAAYTKEQFDDKFNNTDNIFIIGGDQIYKSFYDQIDELYLTMYDKEYEADSYFINIFNDKSFVKKEDIKCGYKDGLLWTITKWERIK